MGKLNPKNTSHPILNLATRFSHSQLLEVARLDGAALLARPSFVGDKKKIQDQIRQQDCASRNQSRSRAGLIPGARLSGTAKQTMAMTVGHASAAVRCAPVAVSYTHLRAHET